MMTRVRRPNIHPLAAFGRRMSHALEFYCAHTEIDVHPCVDTR